MRYVILMCVILCLAAAPVFSGPASTAFSYHGKLTDASGAPMVGSQNLTFRLFDAPDMGNQVGSTVTLASVAVTNGLFTVHLDFGTAPFNGQRL